jgi:hypothetical protein
MMTILRGCHRQCSRVHGEKQFKTFHSGEITVSSKAKKADNKIQGSGGDQGGSSKGSSKKEQGRKSSGNKKSGT